MENNTQQREYVLSCLITKDAATKVFIGHCLDHDLMDCGKTSDEAWSNLKSVIKRHIEYCISARPDGLARRAKKEHWDAFCEAVQRNPGSLTMETIEIDSPAPLPEHEVGLWLQKFTLGELQIDSITTGPAHVS